MVIWALTILGTAFFLSMIAFAVALNIRPGIVQITERFVGPAGTKTEVDVVHVQRGFYRDKGGVVTCRGQRHCLPSIL